nr:MAG TPA: hypothetical protein [Bacteriophage sp.]
MTTQNSYITIRLKVSKPQYSKADRFTSRQQAIFLYP